MSGTAEQPRLLLATARNCVQLCARLSGTAELLPSHGAPPPLLACVYFGAACQVGCSCKQFGALLRGLANGPNSHRRLHCWTAERGLAKGPKTTEGRGSIQLELPACERRTVQPQPRDRHRAARSFCYMTLAVCVCDGGGTHTCVLGWRGQHARQQHAAAAADAAAATAAQSRQVIWGPCHLCGTRTERTQVVQERGG